MGEAGKSGAPTAVGAAEATDGLSRGTAVDRYVIIDVLGRGGMGVVYTAYDTQLDRKLAIKLLRPEFGGVGATTEVESRLVREAQALARLSHPNVVAVHDVGTHEGRIFLAMEFVEGVTLKQWLKAPHSLRERLRTMCDAGRGLAAAHASGLVHRDFNPGNILVGTDGRVVVVDFGLARSNADTTPEAPLPALPVLANATTNGGSASALDNPLTMTGCLLGTIGYMAPEQLFAETVTAASDQFSFAATLYVALYGEKPFPDTDVEGYADQVHKPPALCSGAKDVPAWLRRVVLRGLSVDPKERFPSMSAMIVELERDPLASRRRAAALASAFVLVGVGLFALGAGLRQRSHACAPDFAELRDVWDDSVREKMKAAFARSGADRESAERVATKVDAFATAWTGMRSEICKATRLRNEMPLDVARLRNECLDRERMDLQSMTVILANADARTVQRSVEMAYGLPQTSWCADVPRLRASAGLPDDPAKRAQVLEVRAKLADANATHVAGDLKTAQRLAADAVALARSTDHRATIAEALYQLAFVVQSQGDYEAGVALFREALFAATAAGTDSTVVQAARMLAFATGPKLQRADEARLWLELARSSLARMGGNEELDVVVKGTEASLYTELEWRPDLALPIRKKILEVQRSRYGTDPKTETALYSTGTALAYLGEPARAIPYFEEATAMDQALGGPLYQRGGFAMYELGMANVEVGETAKGEELLHRAHAVFLHNGSDYWSALAFQALTWSALAKGDIPSAVTNAETSTALLAKAKRPSHLIPIVLVPAATAFLRAGRASEALPLCEEALSEQEKTKAFSPERTYGWDALRCEGEALLLLGRSADAVAYLERSLTLHRRVFPGDYARAAFALARALGATHRDNERATALATAARDEFRRTPFLSFELHEVDEWLAGRASRVRM